MGLTCHRLAAALAAAALASACATTRVVVQQSYSAAPTEPESAPYAAPEAPPPSPAFAQLAGWPQEDHLAAFDAFRRGCTVSREAAFAAVCRRAASLGSVDERGARAFLEENFRLEPAPGSGLLTAYFSPVYDARIRPDAEFSAPVRPTPPTGAVAGDRAEIEARPCLGALAWMRPEDLFFLQIQGSGTLVFADGGRRRALFGASNGAPFVGIAGPMGRMGLIAADNASAEAVRAWLAANRGARAAAVMDLDPRYVFFRLAAEDGEEPTGAAGARLIAGRSVAVDPSRHAFGELLWIDAEAPTLTGAVPAYRRLAVALDTGGAIRGEARADLYLGRGPRAGLEAGRVRHVLRLYRLRPIEQPAS